MYLRKQTPEEVLESIKLRMVYSSSKTLNENLKSINEQSSECPNSISYDDLKNLGITAGNIVKKMDASFVRMGYGEERSKELYDIIKSLVGKNVYDDLTNECVNAIQKFKQSFKETGSRGWFESGFDLDQKINEFKTGYYENEPEVLRYLNATTKLLNQSGLPTPSPKPTPGNSRQQNINNAFCNLSKDNIITGGFFKGKPWEDYSKKYNITSQEIEIARSSCPKKNGTLPIPGKKKYQFCKSFPFRQGCTNRLITEVQSCLGLPKKYKTGNFGPITLKSLNSRLVALGQPKVSEITQEVYNTIINNCISTNNVSDTKQSNPVSLDRTERPSLELGSNLPTKISGNVQLSSNVTGEQLFNTYVKLKNLYKRGDDWVFKGDNMTQDNLDKVSQYMKDQGYRTLDKGDKRYGEKFVWKK